ncbi:MAG: hypothetical protein RLZZ500_992 [Bacteroidota bacterium]|jgi:hypothetical protein
MKPFVFVFALISFVCNGQTLTALYPTSGYSGNSFGHQVALDENGHFFAATKNTFFNGQKGRIYRFDITIGNPIQTNFLEVSALTSDDEFAYSFDVNQNFVVAGAPGMDGAFTNSGSVYVFENSNSGTLVQTISAPNPAAEAHFGRNIHLLGNFLFVSQISSLSGNSGSVYVYQFNGTTFSFVQQITAPGTPYFGSKIWSHNNRIYLGCGIFGYNSGDFQSFAAFDWNGTAWVNNSTFGFTNTSGHMIRDIAFHNNDLLVLTNDFSANYLTTWSHNGTSWNSVNNINLNFGDYIVNSLKVRGDIMAIGASNYILQVERKFPVRIYQWSNTTWNLSHSLNGQGADNQDDAFGINSAMNSQGIGLGAPLENIFGNNDGRAYFIPFSSLGANAFATPSFTLYPNPAQDFIQLNPDFHFQKIQLFDLLGKEVTFSIEKGSIPIAHLESGMYILQATQENGVISATKFLKN